MRVVVVSVLLFVAACAPFAASMPPSPAQAPSARYSDEVIVAERAFAAEAGRTGWVEAFGKYAAADALQMGARPENAQDALKRIDPANLHDTSLNWGPEYAAASRNGQLAFTAGPYNGGDTAFGQYFTVWKRQADGSWRWVFDGGSNQRATTTVNAQAIVFVPQSYDGPITATAADAEAAFAQRAASDAPGALAAALIPDGRVVREGRPPAMGDAAARQLVSAGTAMVQYAAPLHTESAPDLVFMLGEARWPNGFGYYTRIWMWTSNGWKIAFDQIIERTPEQAAAAQ